jgi:hypothetical protein
VSNIPEYLFPTETHTLSFLNTLQNPIPGLLTPNNSLTTANSPKLTHIVSRAAFTETKGEIHRTIEEGSPLSCLLTLSSVASYINPASILSENTFGLTFDSKTPLSPLILPSHSQFDPVYILIPQPQEEGATISSTLSSPSYHIQFPSPHSCITTHSDLFGCSLPKHPTSPAFSFCYCCTERDKS